MAKLWMLAAALLGLSALAPAFAQSPSCLEVVPKDVSSSFSLVVQHTSSKTEQYYFSQSRPMTVELWAKANLQPAISPVTLVSAFNESGSPWNFDLSIDSDPQGVLEVRVATGGGNAVFSTSLNATTDASQWTHYAVRLSYVGNGNISLDIRVKSINGPSFDGNTVFPGTPGSAPAPDLEWKLPLTTLSGVFARREFRVWRGAVADTGISGNRYTAFRVSPYDPNLVINLGLESPAVSAGAALGSPGSTPFANPIDAYGAPVAVKDVIGQGGVWASSSLCSSLNYPGASGGGQNTTGNNNNNNNNNNNGQCFNPQGPPQYTMLYDLKCPPNVTLAVRPVDVPVGAQTKAFCGAQMPDLRYLISADWSDPAIQISQQPAAGSFLPPDSFTVAAPDGSEWRNASGAVPQQPVPSTGQWATFTVNNGAGKGPNGTCTFRVVVDDKGGPPLCPGACPPRHLLFPIPTAGTCGVSPIPDIMQNFTLPPPRCISPAGPPAYQLVDISNPSGTPPFSLYAGTSGDLLSRYSKDFEIRPVNPPAGGRAPACPVRVSAYFDQPPQLQATGGVSVSYGPDAINSTQWAAAVAANSNPAQYSYLMASSLPGVVPGTSACYSNQIYTNNCKPRISVEYPPEIAGRAGFQPDIDAAGNFTFGPRGPAWSIPTPSYFGIYFSRLVPDNLLTDPSIPGGALLRSYAISLTCTFNRGLPPPARLHVVSLPIPTRVEVRKPNPPAPAPPA